MERPEVVFAVLAAVGLLATYVVRHLTGRRSADVDVDEVSQSWLMQHSDGMQDDRSSHGASSVRATSR